eukprot:6112719-Pleurochrysis_carterae.AAC.1
MRTSLAQPPIRNPANARAARVQCADRLADRLSAVTGPYAICPDDPSPLRELCRHAEATRSAGIPANTAKSD